MTLLLTVPTGVAGQIAGASGLSADLLQLIKIPAIITNQQLRANYLIEHYWDNCSLNNEAVITTHKEKLEQMLVDYIYVLPHAAKESQTVGIKNMFAKASESKKVYKQLLSLVEKYLYEPDSPMMNEEQYIMFLEQVINGKVLSSIEKLRYSDQLSQAKKNRVGSKATDFSFSLSGGGTSKLSESIGCNLTLLIFYDSECEHCDEILNRIKSDNALSKKVVSKEIKVLAVCVTGSKPLWMAHRATLPESWTVGYAQSNFDDLELYSIRAFPTLYLLDVNRRVVLKDPKAADLLHEINRL